MFQLDYRICSIIVIVTKPPLKDMFGKDFKDILQEFYWYVSNPFCCYTFCSCFEFGLSAMCPPDVCLGLSPLPVTVANEGL